MTTDARHRDVMDDERLRQLEISVSLRAPLDAAVLLAPEPDAVVAEILSRLDDSTAVRVAASLPEDRQKALALLIPELSEPEGQWHINLAYPEKSVGRLMEPVVAILPPRMAVTEAIESLRPFAAEKQLVYAYVLDELEILIGVVVMRDLLFAGPGASIADVMVTQPFFFYADTLADDATRAVLQRHYPMYPVCDHEGRLLGVIRGYALFEQQTVNLSAQAGRMVGVEGEEHLNTPWRKCLALRHPWLQLNLLTAFVAGAVVGVFEDTIAQVVALAAFLPVLAGQAGNTGCQALAVTLRSMILNELKPGMEPELFKKEIFLGLANGVLVGLTAGVAMFAYALVNNTADPATLAAIVVIAMLGSCAAAGVSGVLVPLTLRRLGADPATASTIFLTTATDVVSMGALLGLATLIIT